MSRTQTQSRVKPCPDLSQSIYWSFTIGLAK